MMNKKKLIAGGISIVAAGLLIFVGTKIAMSSKNDNNQTLQIEKKSPLKILSEILSNSPFNHGPIRVVIYVSP